MAGLGIPSKDEDFIGRIARISRRVHAKQMEREVVRRYLFKAKFAIKRALKKMPWKCSLKKVLVSKALLAMHAHGIFFQRRKFKADIN